MLLSPIQLEQLEEKAVRLIRELLFRNMDIANEIRYATTMGNRYLLMLKVLCLEGSRFVCLVLVCSQLNFLLSAQKHTQ